MKKLLVLAALTLSTTFATTIAMTTSDGDLAPADGLTFTAGWTFSIAGPIDITSLGYYDDQENGLDNDHVVGIFDSTGNLLVSITVPTGTSGTFSNGFRFTSITPYRLEAGSYTIGGFSNLSSDGVLVGGTPTAAPGITILDGGVIALGPAFSVPNISGEGTAVASVNFEFAEAPEPSTMLLSLGAFAALGLKKRFSKQA